MRDDGLPIRDGVRLPRLCAGALACAGVKDGLWKIGGTRRLVYARKELSNRDRLVAAAKLIGR